MRGWETQLGEGESRELRRTLAVLVAAVREALTDDLVGVYLVGSFALHAADIHSDVDFLVVTGGPLTALEDQRLRRVHESLPDSGSHWARNLEGSYVTATQLRQLPGDGGQWLYVDNGSRELHRSSHDDSAVTRWVLRERGRSLFGPEASSLLEPVGAETLRAEAIDQTVRRAAALESDPAIFSNAWGQTHLVTMFCRLWFTASTGGVAGKADAVRWARRESSGRWSELMDRALADRPDPWQRVHQPADPLLTQQMPEFVRDVAKWIGGDRWEPQ